jgi:hypothetical protein
MFYGLILESTITEIPNEVKNFVGALNNNIKKVKEEDFRNTKFEATINPNDRSAAAISNNWKLSKEGIIIKITLPFSGIHYTKEPNPYKYLFNFVKTEFDNSNLTKDYKFYELQVGNKVMYATVNPRKDSDVYLDQAKEILSKDKYYDNYEHPYKYLDEDEIKDAMRVKEFFDKFITKYTDKVSISYSSYGIDLYITSTDHSSTPIMNKYMTIHDKYGKQYDELYEKLYNTEDDKEEKEIYNKLDKLGKEESVEVDKLLIVYKKQSILPALEYAKKETNIKRKFGLDDIDCNIGGSGSSAGSRVYINFFIRL